MPFIKMTAAFVSDFNDAEQLLGNQTQKEIRCKYH